MEAILNYVKPELVVVAIVLYFVGLGLKKAKFIKDKFIPLALGVIGIVLATIYVLATSEINTTQTVFMAIFTSIVQGVLVAGLSTYVSQLIIQGKKEE